MIRIAPFIALLALSTSVFADGPVPAAATADFTSSCSRLAASGKASGALRWYRTAAEARALYLQIFASASKRLVELAATNPGASWAVVIDADETLLDNSPFKCENELLQDPTFNQTLWDAWVATSSAVATPGAAEFVRDVHALGGRVVIVSNREEAKHKAATEKNLRALGIRVDHFALRTSTSDKNPRFEAIATTALPGAKEPPHIRLFLGDNIQDFPGTSQTLGDIGGEFGKRFFVFPNPTYGSWEKNSFH